MVSPTRNEFFGWMNCADSSSVEFMYKERRFELRVNEALELLIGHSRRSADRERFIPALSGENEIVLNVPRLKFPLRLEVHGIVEEVEYGRAWVSVRARGGEHPDTSAIVSSHITMQREPAASHGRAVDQVRHSGRDREVVPLVNESEAMEVNPASHTSYEALESFL